MLKGAIVAAILTGLCSAAHADILFFNFNNHLEEIQAVQKVADANREKLYVIPNMSITAMKRLRDNQAQMDLWGAKLNTDQSLSSAQQTALADRLTALSEQFMTLLPAELNPDSLDQQLTQIQANGRNASITSIVVSGHQAGGAFNGTNGELRAEDFRAVFAKHPDLFAKTDTVFLAGCNAGTFGGFEVDWQGLTPSVQMLIGYDGLAPLGDVGIGIQFLQDALMKKSLLLHAQTAKELRAAYQKIHYAAELNGSVLLFSRQFFANSKGVSDALSQINQCKDLENGPLVSQLERQYDCYINAKPGCESLSTDTGKGAIRQFYNAILSQWQCQRVFIKDSATLLPDTEDVVRLVFHQNVLQNLARVHRQDLLDLQSDLQSAGVSLNLAVFTTPGPQQRKAILDEIARVQAEVGFKASDPTTLLGPQGIAIVVARLFTGALQGTVAGFSRGCLPQTWIDPGATERSSCFSGRNGTPLETWRGTWLTSYESAFRSRCEALPAADCRHFYASQMALAQKTQTPQIFQRIQDALKSGVK